MVNIDFVTARYAEDYSEKEKSLQLGRISLAALMDCKKREFEKDDLIELDPILLNPTAIKPEVKNFLKKPEVKNSFKKPEEVKRKFIKSFKGACGPAGNKTYNLALKNHILKSIEEPEKYGNSRYNGFLFDEGRKKFDAIYDVHHDHLDYLDKELLRVKKFLDFNSDFENVDYSVEMSVEDVIKIVHVEQVKEYYKYLKEIKKDAADIPTRELEIKFKSDAQKIAWMHALGIFDPIKDKCTKEGNINWKRVSEIVASFTDIRSENARRCIEAIYKPSNEQKNNPLKVKGNQDHIAALKRQFNLK